MPFHLNEKLDATALAAGFRENRYLQIKNIFPQDQAEEIHTCLSRETPWGFQYYGPQGRVKLTEEEFNALPQEKRAGVYQHIFQTAPTQFQYMYFFYPLTKSYQSGENPDFPLHKFFALMNSEPVLDFIKKVTGIPELVRADALCSKYLGNCFLQGHMDKREDNTRRVAYVLNMTKNWDPNWGGYLQIFNENSNIEKSFMPTFNALNIFAVPRPHSVGVVPPFCPGERLSIAGWFRDGWD